MLLDPPEAEAEFLTADWALAATAYNRFADELDTSAEEPSTQYASRSMTAPVAQPDPAETAVGPSTAGK
ncbi:hypothetical protein ABT218_11955 [Streptomyces sp. NPDC001455]|uniref:hypothetical protein n=1 Tax=unclassified Streptomyces TaxID=2593676 RepID=UPI00332FF9EA